MTEKKPKKEDSPKATDADPNGAKHRAILTDCFPVIPSITLDGVEICPICGEPID